MSIHSQKKKNNLEERFQKLQQQVYGAPQASDLVMVSSTKKGFTFNATSAQSFNSKLRASSDITYLNSNLIKITLLSSVAIGSQLLLYYLSKNHYINLNFLNIGF